MNLYRVTIQFMEGMRRGRTEMEVRASSRQSAEAQARIGLILACVETPSIRGVEVESLAEETSA